MGASTSYQLGKFSLGTYLAYKHFNGGGKEVPIFNGQVKLGSPMFANGKITFSGFFDVWSQDAFNNMGAADGKTWVFLSEPQI